MKRLFILIVVLLIVAKASPQTAVDSLLQIIGNVSERQKSELYLELAQKLKNDSAKSRAYVQMAYQLAQKNDQVPLQAKSWYRMGEILYDAADYQKAIREFRKALLIYSDLNDQAHVVDCHKQIGLCYYNLDQGEKAVAEFIAGLELCEKDTLATAKLLSNIAMTNARMHNMRDAINYYGKALSLNKAIGNTEGMAVNYNGLGEVYKAIRRQTGALRAYQKAKSLTRDPYLHAVTLFNLAGIYLNYPDSLNKAADYSKQSWADFKKMGMYQYEAEYMQTMGVIYMKQGKSKQAIEAFNQSILLNDKFRKGFKIKAGSYNFLGKVYESMGDYKTAIRQLKLFVLYSDSLAQKEKYDQISDLEKRYESEKKESEIERLEATQKFTLIQLRKNKQLKQLGITSALLLLLLALFIWLKYLDKIKSNRLLEAKNKLIEESEQELRVLNASKNKFFSIIAHDLKNPLHTILGYSDLLNNEYHQFSEKERRKFAFVINQSTHNIFRLLQNLLEWSRSQTGRLSFSPGIIEYQHILDNSLGVLKSLADQKKIVIKTGNDPDLKIFGDPFMIETVLRNLINNAIKFTPEGGQIEVSAKKVEDQVVVSVSDTGIGITQEETQNLFRIDSKVKRKGTNNEEGSGLGLILCQEFVGRHNGKIWVESTPGKGSEFIFSIPAKAIA